MKIVLDLLAFMPTRAHEYDAGLDLYSASDDVYIYPGESELFDTGVHVQLPKNTVGFLKSKSGLNVKHGITSEGVIDVGYTGSIIVKLYNHGSKPYKVCRGDKISQLVMVVYVSERTAQEWHRQFIYLVAEKRGLYSKVCVREP